ncbi:MAG: hypothetical protein PQJ46_07910 [Spirochaetales bacterium]|nr:hypothetical protein [Spirochaetales bacterium]
MNTNHNPEKYEKINHRIGRLTLPAGLLMTFVPLIILAVKFGIGPDLKALVQGIFSISVLMAPVSLVEVLTFTAMLGSGAMYMAYLSGNITNLKIPSAAMAMEVCKTKAGSEEGEIISTIAIAGSVICSEIIIIAGVILLVPLKGVLQQPVIQPAFEQILPALFGAIGIYYILKDWKVAVTPIIIAIVLDLAGDFPTAITIPICVLTSVIAARIIYKKTNA